jgi:biotin carboxyl carrier protein
LIAVSDAFLRNADSSEPCDERAGRERILRHVVAHSRALSAFCLQRLDGQWTLDSKIIASHRVGKEPAEPVLRAAAQAAVEQHQAIRSIVQAGTQTHIVCLAPIAHEPNETIVLGMEWEAGSIDPETTLAVTQFAAVALARSRPSRGEIEAQRATWQSAALLELIANLQNAGSFDAAANLLVDQLRDFFRANQVILGWIRSPGKPCQTCAISGLKDFDRQSPRTLAAEAALTELAMQTDDVMTLRRGDPPIAATLAMANLRDQSSCESLFGHQLILDGQTCGSLLILEDHESTSQPDPRRFLAAAAPLIAGCLRQFSKSEPSRITKFCRNLIPDSQAGRRLAFGTAAAASLAMFVPWSHRVAAPVRLEPVERRFVAAPFAATLERAFVAPGDEVEENQVLARLDGRELEWELAGLEAELQRAEKQRDVAIARRESAAAQQAQLELHRLASKRELLAYRIENLEIRSPLAGVIVTGDLSKAQHAPLEAGQRLFEVAPLQAMVAEIAIPEADLPYVQRGQQVELRIDSNLDTSWRGAIESIRPRAEQRDGQQVFVAEVSLDNTASQLRPGMSGVARITSRSQPIGWILFHRPLESLIRLWGW